MSDELTTAATKKCDCGAADLSVEKPEHVYEHPDYPANIVHRKAMCHIVGPRGLPASMALVEVLPRSAK